jgi:hypothetical protein
MVIIVGVTAFVVAFILGLIAGKSSANPYDNPNYTPLADAERRRQQERLSDYFANPVVNELKKQADENRWKK